MADTTPPNLFAAARSYVLAMSKLLPDFGNDGPAAAVAMPFYLLAGFALELSLKAVMLRGGAAERDLRRVGHELGAAMEGACSVGLRVSPSSDARRLVARLSPVHVAHVARYVPDVEVISLPGAGLTYQTLVAFLADIERQVDVWCDAGTNAGSALR